MNERILSEMAAAAANAWDSLSRYKFWMFGYHAAQWVMLNRLLPRVKQQPSPFKPVVQVARDILATRKEAS